MRLLVLKVPLGRSWRAGRRVDIHIHGVLLMATPPSSRVPLSKVCLGDRWLDLSPGAAVARL